MLATEKLEHLNPEDEQIINDTSNKIQSELIKFEILKKNYSTDTGDVLDVKSREFKVVEKLHEYYEEQLGGFGKLVSYRIDKNFKINIEFEITCSADFLKIFSILKIGVFQNTLKSMRHKFKNKFLYNFELSYIKDDLDELDIYNFEDLDNKIPDENELNKYLGIQYGYKDNFFLIIKPSNGKWI